MSNEYRGLEGHSSEFFGEGREGWYNGDFLKLMASRWELSRVRSVLDVGSGVGHWARTILALLPDGAVIEGVEPEAVWVEEAAKKAEALGQSHRMRFRRGAAEALPFADNSFDLVTCQTVLIHVRERRSALLEMIRVLKPGGLLAVAEPDNLSGAVLLDAEALAFEPVDSILERVRFELVCERGKDALGLGNNSAGGLLPGLFVELGLRDVSVFLNDKASPVLPPYASRMEQVFWEDAKSGAERDVFGWSREEALRYFTAGGGDAQAFEAHWSRARDDRRRVLAGLSSGSYAHAGASVMYLISGRKPGSANGSHAGP